MAAGYADPSWVPDKITCISWSFVGSDEVRVEICGKRGYFESAPRRAMIEKFLPDFHRADIVTGHHILRFDLPVLNAECMRLGLPPLEAKMVQDTMRLPKAKGFKKGQDVLSDLVGTRSKKLPLNWQEWQAAYEEDGWTTIIARCAGDVEQHKQLRVALAERGLLKPPRMWNP